MKNQSKSEELKLRIENLENELVEYESLQKKTAALSELCGLFGVDHKNNINIVVQQTLEILSGACAMYYRFNGEEDPATTNVVNRPPHACEAETLITILNSGLASLNNKQPLVIIEDLSKLPNEDGRALSESNGLASCIAALILLKKEIIGLLCLFDSESRPYSVTDQRVMSTLGIAVAIEEERGAAEKEIRDSEERYRTIIEDIEEGYYEIDIKGNFVFISDVFCDIFGYTKEELLGKNYADFTTPETIEKAFNVYNTVFSTERPAKGIPWEVPGKDGRQKILESSISLIKNQNGFASGFRGIVRDITERRQLEFQLRQAQKMEAIGTLAGGIAHEFNNILGIIIGNTENAVINVDKNKPVKKNLNEIWGATLRAREVIEQMQTFSRNKEVEQGVVSIGSIVKESLKLLRAAIPKTIDIRLDIDCPQDMVNANTTQIHQVLINLCTNASHAMQDSGGVLEVSLTNVEMTAAQHPVLTPGLYLAVRVSDTGTGIPADDASRIFDPYFTTKDAGKGTGMGLAIVHGIVLSHGGDVAVSSVWGKGSAFTVLLPVSKDLPSGHTEYKERDIKGTERILFVDDEEAIVFLAKKNLEQLGYRVTVAAEPKEALEIFKKEPDQYDLVVTDMVMPGMTGDKLTAEVMKIKPTFPVVICSGHCSAVTELKVKEMGARALVMKPFTTKQLALTIREIFEN